MKPIHFILIFSLALFTTCTAPRITSSWKAENLTPEKFKKVLVLGLINEPDRTIRENMEANLVSRLTALGYTAVCSCDEFGPKAFQHMTEQEALTKLTNSGIDAVLTIVLLDKTKERYYVPGRVNYSPYSVYHNRFWGYYSTMYDRVYSPGYYVTDTKYFWESNLYKINTSVQLLYSAQSQSFDPPGSSLVDSYGKMIINDMLKANVIAVQTGEKKPLAF